MPYSAPRPCPKHPKVLLKRGEQCPHCPKHGWNHTQNERERGYGWTWRKIRKQILARDNYLCQPCLRAGRLTPAKEVDHIIPKAKGGKDDNDNLQSICVACHKEKTARENGSRKVGYNEKGEPIGDHHWNTGE